MRKFLKSEQGSIAIMTALVAMVLMIFVGMAIDYSRVLASRSGAQQELDSASLAAVGATTDEDADRIARTYLATSKRTWDAVSVARTATGSATEVKIAGSVTVLTPFLRFAGFPKMTTSILSNAAISDTPISLTVANNSAYGYSDKVMKIHSVIGGTDTVVFSATYTMTDSSGENGRGTGVLTMSPSNGAVDLGNYSTVYFELIVHDYTGPTYTFRSDDPASAQQLYVNGRNIGAGQTFTLDSLIPCGDTISFAWEDSPRSTEWGTQDWFWSATPTCGITQASIRRITH